MGFNFLTEQLDDLIARHNDARANKWLWKSKPLEKNSFLMNYAQQWSNKMAHKNKLFHSDMKDIMELGFSMVAENIAYGQKSPEEVMNTWMKSSGHKSNILNSKFTEIGCGMALSENGRLYWCVCFAK
jgi:uncharacterized protein YkwD